MSSPNVMSPGASSSTMASHKNYHQRVVAFPPTSRRTRPGIESSKMKVIVRVRPSLASETLDGSPIPCISITKGNGSLDKKDTLHILDPKTRRNESYKLDCYDEADDIKKIFSKEVHPILPGLFRGSNATVFAYGATGSGKTYTMQGTSDRPGIMLLAMSKILSLAENSKSTVEISYCEVYLDRCYDLLKTENKELPIMEDAEGLVQLRGLTQVKVRSMDDFQKKFETGCIGRNVHMSSHSHGILIVSVTSVDVNPDLPLMGKLNLVDLAGNESVSINQSLFAPSNVIHALNANKNSVPSRDSKLTRILQDSLRGTSRALMIACLNPLSSQEAQHTVSRAARHRRIVNHMNSESTQETPKGKTVINARLNAGLETKGKSSVKSVKPIFRASGKLLSPVSAKRTSSKLHTRSNPRLGKLLGSPLCVGGVSSIIKEKPNSDSSDTNQTADLQKTDNQKTDTQTDTPAESVETSEDVPTACEVLGMNQTPGFLQFDDDPEKENKSINKVSSEGSSPTLTERLQQLTSAFNEMLTPKNPKMASNAINKESAYSEMFTPKNALAVSGTFTTDNGYSDMLISQNSDIFSTTTTTTEKEFTEMENLQIPSIFPNAITTDSDAAHSSAITCETSMTATEEMPLVNFTPLSPKTPQVQQRVSEENPQYRNFNLADISLRGTPLERFNAHSTGLKKCFVQEYISFLNTASREELLALKGIGTKIANYILELREESPEPFKELEDLERIGLTKTQVQIMFRTTAKNIFS